MSSELSMNLNNSIASLIGQAVSDQLRCNHHSLLLQVENEIALLEGARNE